MNVKTAKKLRKMISHLDEERAIRFIKSGTSKHAVIKKDGTIEVEERGTPQAITNIKRYIYQAMKKYSNQPEVLNALIKNLEEYLNRANAQTKGED